MIPIPDFSPRPGEIEAIEAAGVIVVNIGGIWHVSDSDIFTKTSEAYDPLPQIRESMVDAVRAQLADRMASNCIYGGHPYEIDVYSTQKIGQMATMALASILNSQMVPWPDKFRWIDANNEGVPMTAPDCLAFAATIGSYVSGIILHARTLKDQVAMMDAVGLAAFDPSAGWPEAK